jgi:nucleoside 2-deoxyribosyltransferase
MNKNSDTAQTAPEDAPPEARDADAAVHTRPSPSSKPMAKKGKKKAPASGDGEPKKKGRKPQRSFPIVPLEEALKVPRAIRQKNEGHPFDTNLVARACGLSRKNPKFFYLTTASRDFGFTTGTPRAPKIELTELGRQIVFAGAPDIEKQKTVEAFFNVEKFKQVYDHYNGSNLPEEQYLRNILESEFRIPPIQHAEFVRVFKANCKYLGIESGLKDMPAQSTNGSAKAIDIRVLGQSQGKFDKTAFVIMPFSEKGKQVRPTGFFDEVLKSLITPAGNAAGFGVITARRQDSDIIHHTIINQLLNAELVVADLTDHNPNVLFELGIRLAKEKPVVLVKSKDTGPIFDVDNIRVYPYDQNLWTTTVEADVKGLTERISGTWENREDAVSYMQILTAGPQQTAKT